MKKKKKGNLFFSFLLIQIKGVHTVLNFNQSRVSSGYDSLGTKNANLFEREC